MALTKWRALLIDRVHITVGIQSKSLYGLARSQLNGMKQIQSDIVPHGYIIMHKDDFTTRIGIYPTKNRMIAGIEVGATKMKKYYFRLALHPQSFVGSEFQDFQLVLFALLDEFNYQKLYQTGRVSYVEW